MKVLEIVVAVLLLIGALNWGFVGFFSVNPIALAFGDMTAVTRVIYALIGLSGLYELFGVIFGLKAIQHRWCEAPSTVKH